MYKNVKQGWYRLLNPDKFIKPVDELMKSYRDGHVNYKSSLELKAVRYCDWNNGITKWSLEPFPIRYLKPSTGRFHRYYIDLVIEFSSGEKFLVEIKPYRQSVTPRKPSRNTQKAKLRYAREMETYLINTAKWDAAKLFAKENGFKFIILTEKEL